MSPSSIFKLKQFSLTHHQSSMKVSTDSILLGALCQIHSQKSILDIGTGCGILALMMAQKSNADIVAIDVDNASIEEANANFSNSLWSDRLSATCVSIQDFANSQSGKFDLIITNPPYFAEKTFSTDNQRHRARNTDSLSFETLIKSVDKLLTDDGNFWLILPPEEHKHFAILATKQLLSCVLTHKISHTANQNPVLIVSHWQRFNRQNVHLVKTLAIYDEHQNFTSDFKQVTADFYPHF